MALPPWFHYQYFECVSIKITILKFPVPIFDIKYSTCQKSIHISRFDFDVSGGLRLWLWLWLRLEALPLTLPLLLLQLERARLAAANGRALEPGEEGLLLLLVDGVVAAERGHQLRVRQRLHPHLQDPLACQHVPVHKPRNRHS